MDVGFVINPVAGMGGSVALKGTDGRSAEALARGARPQSGRRAGETLALLAGVPVHFLTCSGEMGERALRHAGITGYEVLYRYTGMSTARDTIEAVRAFVAHGVDLIVFCGGDGTARDVVSVTGTHTPLLGIPAGVKMYSGVFAVDPAAAAGIIRQLPDATYRDAEVVDVDEEAYRRGEMRTRIFAAARVPTLPGKTQPAKEVFEDQDEERAKEDLARFITEVMRDDTLYILGAGTTTEHIAEKIGLAKTLLGVDAVKGRKLVARDADETTLLALIAGEERVKIIVSPIGAQGFILGRGSQQISPEVVKRAGVENIIVVATPHKLSQTPALYIDSGDPALNAQFGETIQVISGYRIAQRKRIIVSR